MTTLLNVPVKPKRRPMAKAMILLNEPVLLSKLMLFMVGLFMASLGSGGRSTIHDKRTGSHLTLMV